MTAELVNCPHCGKQTWITFSADSPEKVKYLVSKSTCKKCGQPFQARKYGFPDRRNTGKNQA